MKRIFSDFTKSRRVKSIVCIAAIVILAALVPTGSAMLEAAKKFASPHGKGVIVLDPGHGGFDGGAESESGTAEKDINLNIALELRTLLEKDGYKVVMTRETDTELGESESTAIRSKKTADLIARKDIIDDEKPFLTVSIHLNSFKEDRSVRGAQVFYPKGSEDDEAIVKSKALAEAIQAELISGIDDGTNRAVLAKDDVRILKNVLTPIVIVECGFLSNYEESKLLENGDYQQKLAICIRNGINQYVNCK